MFTSYFKNLFSTSNLESNSIANALSGMQPKVDQNMNNRLLAAFTKTEVEYAVKQMFSTKAPVG